MKKYFRFFVIFLALSCWIPHVASAQVVNIPDANLEAALRELFESENVLEPNEPITKQHMELILSVNLSGQNIKDLTGLEHATSLEGVSLSGNQISNLSPLAGLTQLEELRFQLNGISNINSLAGLTQLRILDLGFNEINDVSPLAGLTQLERLDLWLNSISDVRPLAGLTKLKWLNLDGNEISDVSPLAGLTQLVLLSLNINEISDVSPLAGLTQLVNLQLAINKIQDVSPLASLVNLQTLFLSENPITDTSPLASLTKLVDVDVEITAPLPDPLPEDSLPEDPLPGDPLPEDPLPGDPLPEDSLPEDPLPEDPLPSPEPEPESETPAPSTIIAGQITFSELMFATDGGLFSQPQWIELYNNAPIDTEPVNLRGSRLVIEARDSETRHRYSVIEFEDLHIAPNWTVLLVTRGNSRGSGYLSEERVYDLYDHSNVSSLGLRENAVLPASGFSLKLFAADGTLVDSVGNLDGRKRTKDTPAWELPSGWTEDRVRTSLIRRYEAGMALPGTEAMSWVRAADVQLAVNTYYGRETDVGTPGYRRGGPLPVELSAFRSEQTDAGVSIEWTTESETDNAGFNILRAQTKDGAFVKVNPTLIPGAGTTAERNNYTWTDTTAKPNVAYYYRIEDVSFSGNRQSLATVRMRGYVSASDKLTAVWGELKVQD